MSRRPVPEDKLTEMKRLYDKGELSIGEIAMEVNIPRRTAVAYVHAWNNNFDSPFGYNVSMLTARGKDPTEYCNGIRESNRNKPENQIFAGYIIAGINCSGESRKDLAFKIGCGTDALRLWSHGSAVPKGEKLRKVCEVLDLPYDWMKGLVERKKGKKRDRRRVEMFETLSG
ncbi:MAG: helix-turn-helix transcriptional regulator [Nanoarchaeota archaeon]